MRRTFFLIGVILIMLYITNVNAEPCFGYIINEKTNECVRGFLYDEYGNSPQYSNCYVIDGCTDPKFDWNLSNINCTYIGCANNCRKNETEASVTSIGCIEKDGIDKNFSAFFTIALVVVFIVFIFLIFKKKNN